ncbi:SpoIIE family protein phosphatase [Candidatus Sumerlaeota bacterium]|nr:SpoIIE family protein phosphatase [Candidatus Sumerlaeota bacterium]
MNPLRVLLVDDEAQILDILGRMLNQRADFAHASAGDGEQALKILEKEDFDVLLTDLIMPGMSGLDLIRKARALRPQIVSIILTGRGSRSATIEAIKEGVFEFVEKPIADTPSFHMVVDRAGARSRLVRERDRLMADLQARNADLQKSLSRLSEAYERLRRQEQALESDLLQAQRIQQALLPQGFPSIRGIDLFGFFGPCERMGGDFFDVIPLGRDRVAIYLADVAGHGVGAAMITVIIREMIHAEQSRGDGIGIFSNPAKALSFLNQGLLREAFDPLRLVTMGYMAIDGTRGDVVCACAGHPPPLLVSDPSGGGFVSAGGPALGLVSSPEFETVRISLKPGDFALLYSDGLTEARNARGEELGALAVARAIAPSYGRTARDIGSRIESIWRRHKGEAPSGDDVTFVVVGASSGAAVTRERVLPGSVQIAGCDSPGVVEIPAPSRIARGWNAGRLVIALPGKATWQEAPIVRQIVDEAVRTGAPSIHLDMSECELLDSTMLGVLCQIGDKACVHNVSDGVMLQFRELGIADRLRIVPEPAPKADMAAVSIPQIDERQVSDIILSAHETLIQSTPANRARFEPALDLMRESRAQPSGGDTVEEKDPKRR